MATIRRRKPRSMRRRDGLIAYARDETSQGGEDGVLQRIFELIPPSEDVEGNVQRRSLLDVGAWDGKHLSNTFTLLTKYGWWGVLIEADTDRFAELSELHDPLGNSCICRAVSCAEGSEDSLPCIVSTSNPSLGTLPVDFDLASIDVDGTDYWLMASLLQSYRPKVLVVEFNPTIPDDIIYIQPRVDGIRHGSSLSALVELGEENGYTLVETTLFNAFLVPNELFDKHLKPHVPDSSIEALHEVTMGTSLYQLYDGTLKLAGCRKLLWHRKPILETDIQVLRKEERVFPFAPPSSLPSGSSVGQAWMPQGVVNLSAFCSRSQSAAVTDASGGTGAQACITELWQTLSKNGFALVSGTGVHPQLCRDALEATRQYFSADESLRQSTLAGDRARRGYSPVGTENFASLAGDDAPNDVVKKFRVGNEGRTSNLESGSALLSSNAWPTEEAWGEEALIFRESIEKYYQSLERAGRTILSAILEGMRQFSAESASRCMNLLAGGGCAATQTSILTLLGYEAKKKKSKKQPRPLVAAHTDVGVITVLVFDNGDCAALQRLDSDGSWCDVALPPTVPEDPVFVVNVGDCLSELSGGALRSTMHRVRVSAGASARHTLALFVGFAPNVELTMPGSGEAQAPYSTTYEDWRRSRVLRATTALRAARERKCAEKKRPVTSADTADTSAARSNEADEAGGS